MQVQAVSIPFAQATASPITKASSGNDSNPSTPTPTEDANSMFLKLLVAQLQNQTPFNPVDPMQFTSELVQFNMLDQLTQINTTLQEIPNAAVRPTSGGN